MQHFVPHFLSPGIFSGQPHRSSLIRPFLKQDEIQITSLILDAWSPRYRTTRRKRCRKKPRRSRQNERSGVQSLVFSGNGLHDPTTSFQVNIRNSGWHAAPCCTMMHHDASCSHSPLYEMSCLLGRGHRPGMQKCGWVGFAHETCGRMNELLRSNRLFKSKNRLN